MRTRLTHSELYWLLAIIWAWGVVSGYCLHIVLEALRRSQ